MKKKFSTLQIVTFILIVLCIVWEVNIQQYLAANGLYNTTETRVDLLFVLPVLVVFVGVSIWQYFKRK